MGQIWRKYTEELLSEAVFDIDTSHFVRHQNGSTGRRRKADDILVRIPYGSKRTSPALLRRAANLRFLCPNCHTQTDNFSGRSRGKYAASTVTPGRSLD